MPSKLFDPIQFDLHLYSQYFYIQLKFYLNLQINIQWPSAYKNALFRKLFVRYFMCYIQMTPISRKIITSYVSLRTKHHFSTQSIKSLHFLWQYYNFGFTNYRILFLTLESNCHLYHFHKLLTIAFYFHHISIPSITSQHEVLTTFAYETIFIIYGTNRNLFSSIQTAKSIKTDKRTFWRTMEKESLTCYWQVNFYSGLKRIEGGCWLSVRFLFKSSQNDNGHINAKVGLNNVMWKSKTYRLVIVFF